MQYCNMLWLGKMHFMDCGSWGELNYGTAQWKTQMQICFLFQNSLLREVTCELVMKRKYVLETTLPLLNFTFINCFSDADIQIFDWIRQSFNAKLIWHTHCYRRRAIPGVSSGTSLKIKLPTLSGTEFWITVQKDYIEPSEKAISVRIPLATSLCCNERYLQFSLYRTNAYQT